MHRGALLDDARALDVPHRCVTVDADYGDKPPFLNALEHRGERYVVAWPRVSGRRPCAGVPATASTVLDHARAPALEHRDPNEHRYGKYDEALPPKKYEDTPS